MKLPIALQLYSVRDALAEDFYGTLKKVKEMGYDGVEFAGLYGNSPEDIRAMCDEIGLVPISAHVPYYDMLENPTEVLKDYKEILPEIIEKGIDCIEFHAISTDENEVDEMMEKESVTQKVSTGLNNTKEGD